jgi:hypothetical protein
MRLAYEKLVNFNKFIITEFIDSIFLEKYVSIIDIEKGIDFTKVIINTDFPKNALTNEISGISYSTDLLGAGRVIAIGERDFLLNEIINNNSIEQFNIPISDFTPDYLQSNLDHKSIILISSNIKLGLLNKREWLRSIELKNKEVIFNCFHDFISLPEKILKNKIIIIDDKFAIKLLRKVFYNKYTKQKEKLNIVLETDSNKDNISISVYSELKIDYIDTNLIKIIIID